jgi:hypothetical protein
MSKDPSSFFGGLLETCIRDDYVRRGDPLKESVVFTILGIGCSVLTLYAFSLLGSFV